MKTGNRKTPKTEHQKKPERMEQAPMQQTKFNQLIMVCPICQEKTLHGYYRDLTGDDVVLDDYFLPSLAQPDESIGENENGALSRFNHYFCPTDLFAFSGNVRQDQHTQEPEDNTFYRMSRFLRRKDTNYKGKRIQFFIQALLENGLDPRDLAPTAEAPPEYAEVFLQVWRLVDSCISTRVDGPQIYDIFQKIHSKLGWNPFVRLVPDFHKNPVFLKSYMELQLSDLLYLIRRTQTSSPHHPPYNQLYETISRLKNLVQFVKYLDTDLIAEVLFQCLKLTTISQGPHTELLLKTAYYCSGYLLGRYLRIGINWNSDLQSLHRNPDVLLCLNLQLAKDLGINNPNRSVLLGFLEKRLRTVNDYLYPVKEEKSLIVSEYGKHIRRQFEFLNQ